MAFKPRESDGLNLKALIEELGSDPEAAKQNAFHENIVRALYNVARLATDAQVLTSAQAALIADLDAGDYDTGARLNTQFKSPGTFDSTWWGHLNTMIPDGNVLIPSAGAISGLRCWLQAGTSTTTLKASGTRVVNGVTYNDGDTILTLTSKQTVFMMSSIWSGQWIMNKYSIA